MKRRMFIWMLLTVFATATTGFTIHQCCCEINKSKSCCSAADSDGCTEDISYHKLQLDLQSAVKAETSFAVFSCLVEGFSVPRPAAVDRWITPAHNGPPDLCDLLSLARLRVFRL